MNTRDTYDSFQILTHHVSHAVFSYFSDAHSVAMINALQPAHLVLHDLAEQIFDEDAIVDIGFLSHAIDADQDTPFFTRAKSRGETSGQYVKIGNELKHVNRGKANRLTRVTSQNAYEYLLAVTSDYMKFKDAMLAHDIVALYDDYAQPAQNSLRNDSLRRGMRSLFNCLVLGQKTLPMAGRPIVDDAVHLFMHFSNSVEEYLQRCLPEYEGRILPMDSAYPLTWQERSEMKRTLGVVASEIAAQNIAVRLFDKQNFEEKRGENRAQFKELMRAALRPQMLDVMISRRRSSRHNGCGYYMKVDDRHPVEPYFSVDPGGFDYVDCE